MKSILLREIALFDDICQRDFNGRFYDLHNDFNCYEFKYEDNTLILGFLETNNSTKLRMYFPESEIIFLNFVTENQEDNLTIEMLYRGRLEKEGKLFDFCNDGRSLIYFEFSSGLSGQFLSKILSIETM